MDIEQLGAQLIQALQGALKPGLAAGSALVRQQAETMAHATVQLAELRLNGSFKHNDTAYEKAKGHLAVLGKNFVLALTNLALAAVEQAYNAVMKVVWGAIEQVVGKTGLGNFLPTFADLA